jgi:uncharacterized protein
MSADDRRPFEPVVGTHHVHAAGPPAPAAARPAPPAHAEPAVRAYRRRVVTTTGVGGAGLLGISLSTKAGSPQFYLLTMGLAGTWAAGALSSGPLPLNRTQGQDGAQRWPVVMPVLAGAAAFGLFYGAAQLARHIPPLNHAIRSVLRYADDGSTPLVLLTACANAVAEELFFRGALRSLVQDSHPLAKTTLAYAATTAATRNPALVLAGTATSVLSASSAAPPAASWRRRSHTSHGRSSCCATSRPCS